MEWSVHLARRERPLAVAAVVVIVAASLAAGYGWRSALFGLLTAFLLVVSIGDFVFPMRFIFDADGIQRRGLLIRQRMSWSQVRRVRRDRLGVKLSPLARRSRLEGYRGIYVYFEGNAEDVMTFIAHHVTTEAAGGVDLSSA